MKTPDFLRAYFLFLLGVSVLAACTTPRTQEQKSDIEEDTLYAVQINTDSLYNSHQRICMLVLDKKDIHRFQMLFTYHANELKTTSKLAENRGALAAINGSFFDVDRGGSVTYFEVNDSVISRMRESGLKWAVPDSLANGAILLTKQHALKIEAAKREQYYEESQREKFVLISGPLLISSSLAQNLPDMKFTHQRHPRTCLGITEESLIFMTVDGRTEKADGMSLYELQQYLLDLGCTDAINLDGGET